jgi:hypothetical protein
VKVDSNGHIIELNYFDIALEGLKKQGCESFSQDSNLGVPKYKAEKLTKL